MNCIFCSIIACERPAVAVHQDTHTFSSMDLRQGNPGHALVLPKGHYEDIFALPEVAGEAVMRSVIRMSRAVRDAFQCPGLNIWQSNEECAGQEIHHVHFHVHPRQPGDGPLKAYQRPPATPPAETLKEYASLIRAALGDVVGHRVRTLPLW